MSLIRCLRWKILNTLNDSRMRKACWIKRFVVNAGSRNCSHSSRVLFSPSFSSRTKHTWAHWRLKEIVFRESNQRIWTEDGGCLFTFLRLAHFLRIFSAQLWMGLEPDGVHDSLCLLFALQCYKTVSIYEYYYVSF